MTISFFIIIIIIVIIVIVIIVVIIIIIDLPEAEFFGSSSFRGFLPFCRGLGQNIQVFSSETDCSWRSARKILAIGVRDTQQYRLDKGLGPDRTICPSVRNVWRSAIRDMHVEHLIQYRDCLGSWSRQDEISPGAFGVVFFHEVRIWILEGLTRADF